MDAGQTRRVNTLEDLLAAGREAYSQGDKHAAHELWRMAAVANPYDERVWTALMDVLTRDDDREVCLENIIAINPLNPDARRQLRAIKRSQQEDTTLSAAELESASRRQFRAQKREERLKAEAEAADEPFIPPARKTQTVRSIASEEVTEFTFDDVEEEAPPRQRSALRSVVRGVEIGLLAVLVALIASVVAYGGVISLPR
jgi:hypothetical protein